MQFNADNIEITSTGPGAVRQNADARFSRPEEPLHRDNERARDEMDLDQLAQHRRDSWIEFMSTVFGQGYVPPRLAPTSSHNPSRMLDVISFHAKFSDYNPETNVAGLKMRAGRLEVTPDRLTYTPAQTKSKNGSFTMQDAYAIALILSQNQKNLVPNVLKITGPKQHAWMIQEAIKSYNEHLPPGQRMRVDSPVSRPASFLLRAPKLSFDEFLAPGASAPRVDAPFNPPPQQSDAEPGQQTAPGIAVGDNQAVPAGRVRPGPGQSKAATADRQAAAAHGSAFDVPISGPSIEEILEEEFKNIAQQRKGQQASSVEPERTEQPIRHVPPQTVQEPPMRVNYKVDYTGVNMTEHLFGTLRGTFHINTADGPAELSRGQMVNHVSRPDVDIEFKGLHGKMGSDGKVYADVIMNGKSYVADPVQLIVPKPSV